MTQLCLNRFLLPPELILIIKDFIWPDKELHRLINIKKYICKIIDTSYCSANIGDITYYDRNWFIQIHENKMHIFFLDAKFCTKCGEYDGWFNTPNICKC